MLMLATACGSTGSSSSASSTSAACKTALQQVLKDDRQVGAAGANAAAVLAVVAQVPAGAGSMKSQLGNSYDQLAHALNASDDTMKRVAPQLRACGLK
jgi:ribosome-binding protein aMBF1 (putative translation factor)